MRSCGIHRDRERPRLGGTGCQGRRPWPVTWEGTLDPIWQLLSPEDRIAQESRGGWVKGAPGVKGQLAGDTRRLQAGLGEGSERGCEVNTLSNWRRHTAWEGCWRWPGAKEAETWPPGGVLAAVKDQYQQQATRRSSESPTLLPFGMEVKPGQGEPEHLGMLAALGGLPGGGEGQLCTGHSPSPGGAGTEGGADR